jgi:hypothetical protein
MATKKVKIANPLKRRNPAAVSLSDPKFRPRIVRDKTKYTRKGRKV